MGGFAFYGSYDDNNLAVEESLLEISTNPRHNFEVPKFQTLIYIMKHFPNILTDIPEEYILDQAASSSLSKALLIVQVAWFCTNCASRRSQGLPLSLLEVSTAAHAFCTLFTYFVWWSKPANVAAPTIMREKGAREVYALLNCSGDEYDKALGIARKRAAGDSSTLPGTHGKLHWRRVHSNSFSQPQSDHYALCVLSIVVVCWFPALFGIIHPTMVGPPPWS